jgi:hypothetical protein
MFQLIRALPTRQLLARQAPTIAASLAIAEVFYKFHSFTLECGAFLATWFALDAAVQGAMSLAAGPRPGHSEALG